MRLTVIQILPALEVGGVERGTVEVAAELVRQGHRAIVISAGGRLVQELMAAGAEHLPWTIGAKSPFTLRYVPKLRRLLAETRTDILHARSRLPAWISYLAWRGMPAMARPRFVTTVHGPYTVNRYSRIMMRGERLIAISEYIREYVLKNYPDVDPARIRVIHRGIDPAQYPHGYTPPAGWLAEWRRMFPQLAGRQLVTLPARITRWKGHEDFIAILRALVEQELPVHGLIAGGAGAGRRRFLREIERLVAAASLGDRVTFLGQRNDLREIMSVSSVVMSLAATPEAFGRTALEALSLGVPVVAYAHGGVREVLDSIFPRGLVPPRDIAAASARIRELLAHEIRVPPVAHPFTLRRMLDQTLAVYEDLAARAA